FDHVNSDFVAQLESRGYAFEQILYHPKDWELDEDCQGGSGCSFASEYEFTLMSQMNFGDITLTPLTNFPLTGSLLDSNLGTITLEHAPGHTCGTLDVRVDWTDTVGGQPQARRAWLRGAGCNVSYTPGQVVGGVAITCDIDPHGNVVLTGSPVCP
ncbi:MAG TPA: hypothetical protein VMT18_03180, partial [Planctomycetota bacterium]|nr:hypothetical protein [Planctomycetota bacterium]